MEVIHTNLDESETITPADWVPGPPQGDWTYEAYAALTDDEECLMGAPDLVVEVISPRSKLYDRVNEHMAYEQVGIPEYWMVDPRAQSIELFTLTNGKYRSLGIFKDEQALPSRIVPQMTAPVARFFA